MPPLQHELQLHVRNLLPTSSQWMEHVHADFCRITTGMVVCRFESDSLEAEMLVKLNHHPRLLVVSNVPLVPMFVSWAEQVLGVLTTSCTAKQHVVLGCDLCSSMKMVSLQHACSSKLNLYLHWLLVTHLGLLIAWLHLNSGGHRLLVLLLLLESWLLVLLLLRLLIAGLLLLRRLLIAGLLVLLGLAALNRLLVRLALSWLLELLLLRLRLATLDWLLLLRLLLILRLRSSYRHRLASLYLLLRLSHYWLLGLRLRCRLLLLLRSRHWLLITSCRIRLRAWHRHGLGLLSC